MARFFYIIGRTSCQCACSTITRLFLFEIISKFHMLPDVVRVCIVPYSRISLERMPFVVEERGKENIVSVRLLSRFTRCLAVISMRNLASERTLVYSLAFPALFNT